MVRKVTAMATNLKFRFRRFFHPLIQCVNAVVAVSGQVMVAVSVALCLLAVFKQLYLIQHRSACLKFFLVIYGIGILDVVLMLLVLILSRATKYSFPKIKQHEKKVHLYLQTELKMVVALMLLTAITFKLYTGGHDDQTWPGDHWWIVALQATWWISGLAGWTIALQLLTWRCGTESLEKQLENACRAAQLSEEEAHKFSEALRYDTKALTKALTGVYEYEDLVEFAKEFKKDKERQGDSSSS